MVRPFMASGSSLRPDRRDPAGFTLTEILLAVGAVAILLALTFPSLTRAYDSSKRAGCMNNLKAIGAAAHLYASEHDGQLPGILSTPGEGGAPANQHAGEQWDVQIMPYLGLGPSVPTDNIKTVFYCPASVRNPSAALSRQLSYAWNSRITASSPYNSKRISNLQQPSTTILAVDNKLLGSEPDRNSVTFGSAGNTIYINDNANQLARVAYERHEGKANVLFADGSVSARAPVAPPSNPTPRGVRFYNNGPLSPL